METLALISSVYTSERGECSGEIWELYRTACTRAYYSAYAAITARIAPGTVFAHGWQNPAHAALPGHVHQIPGLSAAKKAVIRIALSQLRQRREDADYRPALRSIALQPGRAGAI